MMGLMKTAETAPVIHSVLSEAGPFCKVQFVEAAANGKAGPYLLLHGGARGRAYLPSRRKVPSSGNTNAAPLVLCCTGNSCVKGTVLPREKSWEHMGSMLTVQFGSQDAADTMRVLGRAAGAFGFTIGFSTSGRKPKVTAGIPSARARKAPNGYAHPHESEVLHDQLH
ncbi:hypothetical protein ABBQ32_002040 [Trebouxia sp. C0010 RCD-2024]